MSASERHLENQFRLWGGLSSSIQQFIASVLFIALPTSACVDDAFITIESEPNPLVAWAATGAPFDSPEGVAVQRDGGVLAAGTFTDGVSAGFFVLRLSPDGELDRRFANAGVFMTNLGAGTSAAGFGGIEIQPDGKIVVAATVTNGTDLEPLLFRLDEDGELDVTFGTGGITRTPGSGSDLVKALLIQPDGRILIGGRSLPDPSGGVDIMLARYEESGELDQTFGAGGVVWTPTPVGPSGGLFATTSTGVVYSLALTENGSILAAGSAGASYTGIGQWGILLARYGPDGNLDPGFGDRGLVFEPLMYSGARDVVVRPDGRIVLVVALYRSEFGLVGFDEDGSIDDSFGIDGYAGIPVGDDSSLAFSMAQQSNDKLVVVGVAYREGRECIAAIRIFGDGSIDAEFGDDGRVIICTGEVTSVARDVALEGDGRIVVGGQSRDDWSHSEVAVVWYRANP